MKMKTLAVLLLALVPLQGFAKTIVNTKNGQVLSADCGHPQLWDHILPWVACDVYKTRANGKTKFVTQFTYTSIASENGLKQLKEHLSRFEMMPVTSAVYGSSSFDGEKTERLELPAVITSVSGISMLIVGAGAGATAVIVAGGAVLGTAGALAASPILLDLLSAPVRKVIYNQRRAKIEQHVEFALEMTKALADKDSNEVIELDNKSFKRLVRIFKSN